MSENIRNIAYSPILQIIMMTVFFAKSNELTPAQLIFSSELGSFHSVLFLQTIYSWFIAAIALILLSPVMLVVAILVKLTLAGSRILPADARGIGRKTFHAVQVPLHAPGCLSKNRSRVGHEKRPARDATRQMAPQTPPG